MQRLICRRDADPTIFLPPQSVTGETPVPRWLRGMAVPPMRKLDRSLPAARQHHFDSRVRRRRIIWRGKSCQD